MCLSVFALVFLFSCSSMKSSIFLQGKQSKISYIVLLFLLNYNLKIIFNEGILTKPLMMSLDGIFLESN